MKQGCFALALLVGLALGAPAALAQPPGSYNVREVKRPISSPDIKEDIWVLDFRFKDPRLITVDVPGRGRKLVWYLWYQVINYTGKPRTFIPDFELVTLDKPADYHDQVLPKVQKAIQEIEDPTRALDIKNSVTISSEPIPVSEPGGVPRKVTGVAIWDDTSKEQFLQDTTHFSIFVGGLSNGLSRVDSKEGDEQLVRRKTLRLNFHRLGGRYYQDNREIRFEPPAEWTYRAVTLSEPAKTAGKGPMKPKTEAKPKEGEEPPMDKDSPKKQKAGTPPKKEEPAKPGPALAPVPDPGPLDLRNPPAPLPPGTTPR